MWHWTNHQIEVAIQIWLWVRVELMGWELSQLEHLNRIQRSWVQIPLWPIFHSHFKESDSSEHNIHELIPLDSYVYLHKTSIKINVATDEGKQPKSNVTLNTPWNWSSCTKLALSASLTLGLIAQSIRASERNSVVVGSNPSQASFR